MRNQLRLSEIVATLALLAAGTAGVRAQGHIIIEPPYPPRPHPGPGQTCLLLKALHVHAAITDGVAVTTLKQTFRNPHPRQIEGVYLFPLPADVAVGDFSMTIGGKTLHGEVLDADQARQTYEDIVRRLRDPALLEYLGARLFRARVFPIPANGDVDIELSYTQTLPEQGGLGLFQHPLRLDPQRAQAVDQLTIVARLRSAMPLTAVFCPSHGCAISRPNDHEALVSYEATHVVPDRDFALYYQRADTEFGLVLLTHHAAGEEGTFLLRLSPRVELSADQILPKDIAFVFDTSGSMAGEKIAQARRALKFCIHGLNPADRFNIYGFSSEVRPFRAALVPATDELRAAAVAYADELKAAGGTNINAALLAALADAPRDTNRVYLIVFMTDGQPTVDLTDPEQIRKNVTQHNTHNTRFHVLGVGSDVNTHLLDQLAEATRGARDYCTENEDLELKLSAFVERLANPVLTNLTLVIEGIATHDLYPKQLPDLFRGTDLVVLGRYADGGLGSIRLEGQVEGRTKSLGYEGEFPAHNLDNDFLPRLWAQRKVAYLLDQIRLHGANAELIDEVTRLAKRHGFVTPYTAALVVEDEERLGRQPIPPPARAGVGIARGGGGGRFGAASTGDAVSGRDAIRVSRELAKEKLSDVLQAGEPGDAEIRHVGSKTFVLRDGCWTDTTWDEVAEPRTVEAFSDAYFDLLMADATLKDYFALGDHVLVVLPDGVIKVVPAPASSPE